MDSRQAARMNSSLNSIAKALQSINRNLASLVESTTTTKEYKRHPINADLYRTEHPERCPQVDSEGPQEEIVSDCGKILTPTQQVRSDDPPSQQMIDDTIEELKNLRWRIHRVRDEERYKRLGRLIIRLEELRGWLQD